MLVERIPLTKMKTMQETLGGEGGGSLVKNFPEEEAYSLSKNSAHDPSETFHPLRICKDVCVGRMVFHSAVPGALALALGFIWRCQVGCCSWGKGTPFPE